MQEVLRTLKIFQQTEFDGQDRAASDDQRVESKDEGELYAAQVIFLLNDERSC